MLSLVLQKPFSKFLNSFIPKIICCLPEPHRLEGLMIKGVDPQRRTWWVSQGTGGGWFVSKGKKEGEKVILKK